MTNLVERDVEEYQQVRGQRGLLDRASIDIGRLVSVSEEARHFTLTVLIGPLVSASYSLRILYHAGPTFTHHTARFHPAVTLS